MGTPSVTTPLSDRTGKSKKSKTVNEMRVRAANSRFQSVDESELGNCEPVLMCTAAGRWGTRQRSGGHPARAGLCTFARALWLESSGGSVESSIDGFKQRCPGFLQSGSGLIIAHGLSLGLHRACRLVPGLGLRRFAGKLLSFSSGVCTRRCG